MNKDLEKIAKLTGLVDRLIQINENDIELNDEVVYEFINKALSISEAEYSYDEMEAAKNDITWRYQIKAEPGQSILGDYDQENWYNNVKDQIEPIFWARYKDYLIDTKHFSPNIVSTLGEDTLNQKLMNYILDPHAQYPSPVLRRGLIIGDVQSGKTSTYIGFMCKAADAGYKVFILLTGTIESLRKQTQERVEEGFIGFDMSANTTGGKRVGVGLDQKPIKSMALTSRNGDFTGDSDKIAVALSGKDAVVFVIKKQKDVLTKLKNWLTSLNADPTTGKIDMPMLMIDDEADNASINTSKSKEDPTTINRLIRELASVFTKSNYVGFTATPFANVFIDPETTEKMETQDLFPENFIVSLPTPSNYIGPNRIFAGNSEFYSQLVYINDAGREEEDGYPFYFKHKKEWSGELPESLTDAIYTFYLANAIRDLRGDLREHRSMLINISRFVNVQKHIKIEVERIHAEAYRSIKYNLSQNHNESMMDPVLEKLYDNWLAQYADCEFNWEQIIESIYKSIETIQIKVVNSSKNSEKLIYPKNESLRVIAIGGLALSRGLTLEGLITSYFYRNTCTYDVLMQMGRWFGYRQNYEDLFRIWTHKSSARWYAEIAEATERLKDDMTLMRDRGLRPRDFGIRVRNNSAELNITASNKMRNAKDEFEFESYFGSIVETPYLHLDVSIQKKNFKSLESLIDDLLRRNYKFERQKVSSGIGHYVIQNIPKRDIIQFIKSVRISKYSSNFDIKQITEFLDNTDDQSIETFDIAFMEGKATNEDKLSAYIGGRKIPKVRRLNCIIDKDTDRIGIGRRGKLGGPGDGKACIVERNGQPAEEIIEAAKAEFRAEFRRKQGYDFTSDKTYPSETWFRYIKNRNPLLLIYLIDIDVDDEESNQEKQVKTFKDEMNGIPALGLAMGLPRNDNVSRITGTKYKANKVYNWFDQEQILAEGDEE